MLNYYSTLENKLRRYALLSFVIVSIVSVDTVGLSSRKVISAAQRRRAHASLTQCIPLQTRKHPCMDQSLTIVSINLPLM